MKPKSKKIVNSILSFVLVVCLLMSGGLLDIGQSIGDAGSFIANAVEVYGDFEYKVNSDNTITITKYIGDGGNVVITGEINEKNVTIIGESAFRGCPGLTSVKIPDGVTSIGNYAFRDCYRLTNITIPDSVMSIGERPFLNCTSLTSITIPDSVVSIGDYAFGYCTSLTSITIPDSVTSIGDDAFYDCTSLTSIAVSKNNENYSSQDSVLFNKNKSEILCCPGGKSGKYTVPDGVTSIGNKAFCNCTSLTSITIPDSVMSIGNSAFYHCRSLKSIVISDRVTHIGDYAFGYCTSLTSITIPDSVVSMGDYAFGYCTSLTSITIPDSVTSIGEAFFGCTSLTSITVSKNNENYSSQDGILFNKNKSEIICFPEGKSGKYTIPDSVTSIGDYAFRSCYRLTNITIPDSVTSIGKYAFGFCFRLANIIISDSVAYIGDMAFLHCDSLEDVYYSGTKEAWNSVNIGSENECLTNANIHFNYHQPSVEIDADAYRFYYSQDTITPGDKFIVGADKLGGNYTGIYYPGPGQVEWEISNRNVIDFIPIHDSKTGKDILYYNDTTQLHLEAKNFGESKLTIKLNGVPVCSEMIEVRYNDDAVIKNYKDQILDTSVMSTLNQGKTASFDVVKKFSKLDQLKISFMTNLDNYMGFGTLAKWIGSSIGLTTSQYEDCVDESVEALIADYLSIEKSVFDDISDLESKYNFIKTAINVGDSKGFGIKNDIIIQNLSQQTSFSAKQISKVFKLAEKFADGALSVAEIGATAVMLAQFDLDVLGKLSSVVQESASGDCGSDMYKSINRIMDRVYNLEDYVNELMATDVLMDQFISLAIDLCLDSKNLTTVGLILEIGDFLAAKYKASGGIMADDYVNTCVSFNNAWVMYHAIEKSTNMADFKFDYEFYVSAVKVALKYAEKLSDGKSDKPYLKDNVINCYELIEKGCSFERLMKEIREIVQTNIKTTSSGASSKTSAYAANEILWVPSYMDGNNVIEISKNELQNIVGKRCIILPNTVRKIANNAFSDCNDLEYIYLNEQLDTIEGNAFKNCEKLKYAIIPKNTKTIENNAFENCSGLSYVEFNLDSIGDNAFLNCVSLAEVYFNNKYTIIGENAFTGCSDNLVIVGYKGSTAEKYAKENNIAFTAIPEYVESIDVVTSAEKTVYEVGEEIDTSGLSLKVKYKDGSEEVVNDGWMVTYDTSSVGEKQVNIIYGEKNISYQITVNQGELPKLSLNYSNLDILYGTGIQLIADVQTKYDYKPAVIFESSNPEVVKVSSTGYVSALKPRKAVITAKIMNTNVTAECVVNAADTVKIDGDTEPQYIVFTPSEDNYYIFTTSESDENVKLTIYDNDSVYAEQEDEKISLKSVLAKDMAYILKVETASEIDLKIRGCEPVSEISIADEDGNEVTNISGKIGTFVKLQPQIYADNSMAEEFYWSSSDSDIAEVDETGKVELKNSGKAVITIRTAHNVQAECEIIVMENGILGDTNGDESVDIADALMIARYDAGLIQLDENQLSVSDVNKDDSVDIADALMIARYDACLINRL